MTHIVVIVKDGSSYRVANGQLKANKGDTVQLHNYAKAKAKIKFDKDNPFGEDFELGDEKTKEQDNLQPGYYPYTVTVNGENAEASRPIIIIYP